MHEQRGMLREKSVAFWSIFKIKRRRGFFFSVTVKLGKTNKQKKENCIEEDLAAVICVVREYIFQRT